MKPSGPIGWRYVSCYHVPRLVVLIFGVQSWYFLHITQAVPDFPRDLNTLYDNAIRFLSLNLWCQPKNYVESGTPTTIIEGATITNTLGSHFRFKPRGVSQYNWVIHHIKI